MILGFAHPCLVVSDAEQAKNFYMAMFGFKLISDTEGWRDMPTVDLAIGLKNSQVQGYLLAGHNCFLEIHQYLSPIATGPQPASLAANDPGIRHLAFLVDDCHLEAKRFVALGGTLVGEPAEVAEQVYSVYCRDPSGNIVELCEALNQAETLLALPGISANDCFSGEYLCSI